MRHERPGRAVIGFLHTSPVHVETFETLVASAVDVVHLVRPDLLAAARTGESVTADVGGCVEELRAAGAGVVVCTCSTIGADAESFGDDVIRVDRPMAQAAVAVGGRIGVIAALASTLAPTSDLLRDEAGGPIEIEYVVVDGAWDLFERGQIAGYLDAVADAARGVAERVEAVVLAQASMAGAVTLLGDLGVPVLASPAAATEFALARLASA